MRAAAVFESHLTTHPAIRVNSEALVLMAEVYCDLDCFDHAVDLVDFIEEYHIKAPEVFNALLRQFISRGDLGKAENLLYRMKKSGSCEITPDTYVRMAELFATNSRKDAIEEILQEVLLWFPDIAYRIHAILIRLYLTLGDIESAQSMMKDMYITGVPFHGSIFAKLLEIRLQQELPDAIRITLIEMQALGVTPSNEFAVATIKTLTKVGQPEVALNFLQALKTSNSPRVAYFYHLLIEHYQQKGDHVKAIEIFELLRHDGVANFTTYSFIRVLYSVLEISKLAYSADDRDQARLETLGIEQKDVDRMILDVTRDVLKSDIGVEPISIGCLIDLLGKSRQEQYAVRLGIHCFEMVKYGKWLITPDLLHAVAYAIYHHGPSDQQRELVDLIMKMQMVPPSFAVAIVLRQMKEEAEESYPNVPERSYFDIPAFIDLLEKHAFELEIPAYLTERFATALIDRGMDLEAGRMFASVMNSKKPVTPVTLNTYKEITSWYHNRPAYYVYDSLPSEKEDPVRTGDQTDEAERDSADRLYARPAEIPSKSPESTSTHANTIDHNSRSNETTFGVSDATTDLDLDQRFSSKLQGANFGQPDEDKIFEPQEVRSQSQNRASTSRSSHPPI
jgi:pentatricopeptide repeat protein